MGHTFQISGDYWVALRRIGNFHSLITEALEIRWSSKVCGDATAMQFFGVLNKRIFSDQFLPLEIIL